MITNGYYLVDKTTNELWEVRYDKSNYKTSDIPTVRKSSITYQDALRQGLKIKTFGEVVSLIPYPQLP